MPSTTEIFFVLRDGETHEEQWTWGEIVERYRSGDFSASSRIFLPDENRWVAAADADLGEPAGDTVTDGLDDEREALEGEYADLVERLEEAPESVEPWIDAAAMAVELGDLDAARGHYQHALDRHPFHERVAQEVRRRFSRAERRAFRLFERPAPIWDDLTELVTFPLSGGWLHLAVPVALFALLMVVPGGAVAIAELGLVGCLYVSVSVSDGRPWTPGWREALSDPVHRLVLPVAAIAGVSAQWLAVFYGIARLGMLVDGTAGEPVLRYISQSPVLVVLMTVCALGYFPAAMVLVSRSWRAVPRALNPWAVVRAMSAMGKEYAMSLLLLFALAAVSAVISFMTGWVSVAGTFIWSVAVVVATMMSALVIGRLRARTAHIFETD